MYQNIDVMKFIILLVQTPKVELLQGMLHVKSVCADACGARELYEYQL